MAPARSQHVPGGLRCHGYLPAEVRHGESPEYRRAVFLDASLIDAGYMASNGDVSFDTDTKTYGVTRKEVPVPVKIVESTMTEQAKAVADYWQAAANDKNAVERFAPEGGEILAAAVVTEEGTMTMPCLPPPT